MPLEVPLKDAVRGSGRAIVVAVKARVSNAAIDEYCILSVVRDSSAG